jgi:hypothetical protein
MTRSTLERKRENYRALGWVGQYLSCDKGSPSERTTAITVGSPSDGTTASNNGEQQMLAVARGASDFEKGEIAGRRIAIPHSTLLLHRVVPHDLDTHFYNYRFPFFSSSSSFSLAVIAVIGSHPSYVLGTSSSSLLPSRLGTRNSPPGATFWK